MKNKKTLIAIMMVLGIILGVALAVYFKHASKGKAVSKAVRHVYDWKVPADFDWKYYVQSYEDLRLLGIDTEEAAKKHWREIGGREGRSYQKTQKPVVEDLASLPSDFSWREYVERYEDLQEMGIDTKEKAVKHWLKIGRREGRKYKDDPLVVPEVPYMPWKSDT